ncbi:UDP-glycosyltransferase UGT5 isoform X3 [Nilaparvata lugens]|uniref:UDP-glycosyltransferase UGT5 isoform X3 n=1 Tax=Nilaparvata lugens TaxID=108931 RepID=UPI00193CB1DA|nr:UDP-glycosyltransferase UGT5 isoform X3 [Nilaparvata lugens]
MIMTSFRLSLFVTVSLVSSFISVTNSARILAIFPISAKSHYITFEPLALELAKRGHELVIVSYFPYQNPIENVTVISTREHTPSLVNELDIVTFQQVGIPKGTFFEIFVLYSLIAEHTRIFEVPGVKNLLKSNEKFDLMMVEVFNTDMFAGFADKFKCPVIGFTSSTIMTGTDARFANPDNPSYIPCVSSEFVAPFTFWQRLSNTVQTFYTSAMFRYVYTPKSDKLARQFFGDSMPPLQSLIVNYSLLLFNGHHSVNGVRPLLPNVVPIGGIHIKPANPLPKELQSFIDGAEHGVIYFCMGSMLKATTIPDDKRDALVKVFSRLPQRVLWKWENDTMPGKSDNVKIVKWMPQRDILEHPNVKLFISHGGLLGTTEAVHCGVPIIGIPFYGDQAGNIEAVASHGAGLRLDYNDINEHNLYDKITQILNNPQYAENAKELSKRFRDRPQSPLETAVYWTEYVIRHKGAPHLRSAAVDLTWYQYLLLDVIAFLLLLAVTVSLLFYYTLKFLIKRLFAKSAPTNKTANKKVKKS